MQRFHPFQAEPYENSNSWEVSLDQHRKVTSMPKTQDADEEPAEETWIGKQKVDEQQKLISVTTSDPVADRVIFH